MLKADVRPEPLRHNNQPATQTQEEKNVGEAPDPPGKPSLEMKATKGDNRGLATDRGKLTPVAVMEGWWRGPAGHLRLDRIGNISALLLGNWGDTWQLLTRCIMSERSVTDDVAIICISWLKA